MYTISEVARSIGITAHTLRYYEKEEIIVPKRNLYGERVYDDSDLAWLRFVVKLKQTQMPIMQIREYTRLYKEGEHTTKDRLKLLEDHREDIQSQMKALAATEKMLEDKITMYKDILSQPDVAH
ncbi:MerR family transcriptional regulator [Paenibacillus sp. sgz500958]|uniref:MerR family transcriptional regulator n=1 Tax=Paenibacillus sp. sgz500958 TaxID=3242475 RepID=UPI0036D36987